MASKIYYLILGTLCPFQHFVSSESLASYEVVHSWKVLDYNFTSPHQKQRYLESKEFVPENNVIAGVKVYGNRVYLTVPRWRIGIPSTLNYVELNKFGGAVPLNPYPNWDMQRVGDCDAFQHIQSMEIDRWGRMWVVDVGRTEIFERRNMPGIGGCKAKIVLLDLGSGRILHKYEFPEGVVNSSSNFLNDIVVGCEGEGKCVAYISDAFDSKLVVYDLEEDRSWFVRHRTMEMDPEAVIIPILDGNYTLKASIDGIALSPLDQNHDRVYYSPLTSYGLFSVKTSILRDMANGAVLQDSDVKTHTLKSSQSDGIGMDSEGLLYFALLNSNSIAYLNTSGDLGFQWKSLLVKDDVDLQWVDTFGFDQLGYLYGVSNRMHRFQNNLLNWSEVNFRVVRVFIGAKSYMYSAKESIYSNLDSSKPLEVKIVEREDNVLGQGHGWSQNSGDTLDI